MTIGPTVRKLRRERKISMKTLAEMARLNAGTIYGIEAMRNNCSLQTAHLIATALGMTTSELIRLVEEETL